MSCTPELAIQSCDTGQRIPYFVSSQLIITWMSNIKFNTVVHTSWTFKLASKTFHIHLHEWGDVQTNGRTIFHNQNFWYA